jgi:hypothetical protein
LWKIEIEELELKKKEGSAPFLKLLQEKYVSYLNNKKLELEESEFETKNLKKTLLKVTKHYHSDKKDLMPGVFN